MTQRIGFEVQAKSGEWKDLEIPNGFIAILQSVTFWVQRSEAVGRKATLNIRTTFDCAPNGDSHSNKVTEILPLCSVTLSEKPKTETIYCVYSEDLRPSVHVEGAARVKITGKFVPDAFDVHDESEPADPVAPAD
jgi:hypothetical protein